jgi:hypothetical protein
MVDPLGALKPGLGTSIQTQLAQLFAVIVNGSSDFGDNRVLFDPNSAAPVRHELLVYFMPAGKSVVKNVPNLNKPVDLNAGGTTVHLAGASEVYVKSDDAVLLAKLAFHELMHNRLKLGDDQLHPQGGLAAASISPSTTLNDRNIKSMQAALNTPITQWTAGIGILNNGKVDPISEYYKI